MQRFSIFALVAFLGIAAPVAADAPVVSWESSAPLVVAPNGMENATLRNDTALTVSVTIKWTGPLKATPEKATLSPGEQVEITLTSTSSNTGDGTVSAVTDPTDGAKDGSVARRDVKVGLMAPEPAITSVKLHSTWGPFGETTGAVVPLSTPTSCKEAAPPSATAGYIRTEDGKQARVTYSCVTDGSTPIGVRLTFHGLANTGAKFEGEIKIGDTNVSVTVARGTTAFYPIIALIVGLVLALYALRLAPGRVVASLRRRLRLAQAAIGTTSHPGQAIADFRKAAGTAPWGNLDIFEDAKHVADEVDSKLSELSSAKRYTLTEDDKEAANIGDMIAMLETAVLSLPELGKQLLALQAAVPIVESSHLLLDWTANVKGDLLSAKTLTVAEVPERLTAAGDAATVAAWWPSVAQQIRNLQIRIDALTHSLDQRPKEEQVRITDAEGKLNAALRAFSRAQTAAEVRAVHTDEFAQAQYAIDALASIQAIMRAGVAGAATGVTSVKISAPDQYLADVSAIEAGQRRAGLMTMLILGAALLAAGLQAVYIGKDFGTGWDFLIALTWGLGAAAVLAPLASAIEGIAFKRDSEPHA